MSVVSLILFVIAAVIFFLGPDGATTPAAPGRYPWTRSSVRLGLFVLTLALIAQFIILNRPVHT
jgi:hypothetical protein